jgi:hypothetical protein
MSGLAKLIAAGGVAFALLGVWIIWLDRGEKGLKTYLGWAVAIGGVVWAVLQVIEGQRNARDAAADKAQAARDLAGVKEKAEIAVATAKQEAADLKKTITRRDLEIRTLETEEMGKVDGIKADIWHDPDDEPSRVAEELRFKMVAAGWQVSVTEIEGRLNPGIDIEAIPFGVSAAGRDRGFEAANALATALGQVGVKARQRNGGAPNELRILVGASDRLNPPVVERIETEKDTSEFSGNLLFGRNADGKPTVRQMKPDELWQPVPAPKADK